MVSHRLNFETDVEIDESALDVEWLKQPELMLKYAAEAARCKKRLDLAKEHLDVVAADLDRSIREDPEHFGLAKLTEAVVQNTIKLQPDYRSAYEKLVEAKYEFDMTMAAVRAIDQKKTALENLVRLHGQQYFAGPSVPRNLSDEWAKERQQKRVDNKVAQKMKRKKGDS